MTKDEYNEAAALVVRLRKDLELHTDALVKSNAQCGEYLRQNEQLHSELVKVRAALASVSAERDSLKRTLDEWERADTKPHTRVTADDVAEHVAPPVLNRGEPDPANDPKDAGLEFRNVVPTPEMIKHVDYWDLVSGAAAIAFTTINPGLVFWRIAGSREWRTDPCPQPLKPHGMTWQQLDKVLADKKAAELPAAPAPSAEVPLCMTCHGCGEAIERVYQNRDLPVICRNMKCNRELSSRSSDGREAMEDPYRGPCKSATTVRHE